jgi:hypothetical protein
VVATGVTTCAAVTATTTTAALAIFVTLSTTIPPSAPPRASPQVFVFEPPLPVPARITYFIVSRELEEGGDPVAVRHDGPTALPRARVVGADRAVLAPRYQHGTAAEEGQGGDPAAMLAAEDALAGAGPGEAEPGEAAVHWGGAKRGRSKRV